MPYTTAINTTELGYPGNATGGMYSFGNLSLTSNSSSESLKASLEFLNNASPNVSIAFFSVGLFGNILALVLMAFSPIEQRRTSFYKLMAGLAFTDIVGTTATSTLVIRSYIVKEQLTQDGILCNYFSFMMTFACFSTMLIVCAMALERYICICHPYAYHCKLPKSFAKYAIAGSWAGAVLIASLPLMGLGKNQLYFPETWCWFELKSTAVQNVVFNYLFGLVSLMCIVLTFVCNIKATAAVLSLKKRQAALQQGGGGGTGGLRRTRGLVQRCAEMHMIVMLMGVTVIFTACYGPLMVFTIICQTSLMNKEMMGHFLTIVRIGSLNPVLDPWVYILVRRELRWKFITVFKKMLGIKSRPISYAGSCNRLPNMEIPTTPRTPRPEPELKEMSFWRFCFHCLCDPPVQRSSNSFFNHSGTWNQQTTLGRSPSVLRKMPSTDSLVGDPCYVHRKPSPSEELMLIQYTHTKDNELNGNTNALVAKNELQVSTHSLNVP